MLKSRKEKYITLIKKYNETDGEEKDKNLIKIIKSQGIYFSFPDKLNNIFKIINKEKYTKSRNIKEDKKLIDFLRASRNTIHNSGIHIGNDIVFEFKGTEYQLIKNKPQFMKNYNDMILMYAELIDIYANILSSIDDIDLEEIVEEEQNEMTLTIFERMIFDYVFDESEQSKEMKNLIVSNFKKIIPNEDKVKKILHFLDNVENINQENLLFKILSNNFNSKFD